MERKTGVWLMASQSALAACEGSDHAVSSPRENVEE